MSKYKRMMLIMGLAAVVILSRCTREASSGIDGQRQLEAIGETRVGQTDSLESETGAAVSGVQEAAIVPEEKSQIVESVMAESGLEDKTVPTCPEEIEEELPVETKAVAILSTEVENSTAEPFVDSIEEVNTEEVDLENEQQELSAETVDEIENALSVSDYAKGLSLLAQLPVETVDRFVEMRKDGFTAEEQAEVKSILLASYEGEDLAWIVETYHKLQP